MSLYLILLIIFIVNLVITLVQVYADLISIQHKKELFLLFYFLNYFVIYHYFLFFIIHLSFNFIILIGHLLILNYQSINLLMVNLVDQAEQHWFEKLYFKLNYLKPLIFLIIQLFYLTIVSIITELINLGEV